MMFAIVNVLPEPVTPSSTCSGSPFFTPHVSFSMASAGRRWAYNQKQAENPLRYLKMPSSASETKSPSATMI